MTGLHIKPPSKIHKYLIFDEKTSANYTSFSVVRAGDVWLSWTCVQSKNQRSHHDVASNELYTIH